MRIRGYERPFAVPRRRHPRLHRRDGPGHDPPRRRRSATAGSATSSARRATSPNGSCRSWRPGSPAPRASGREDVEVVVSACCSVVRRPRDRAAPRVGPRRVLRQRPHLRRLLRLPRPGRAAAGRHRRVPRRHRRRTPRRRGLPRDGRRADDDGRTRRGRRAHRRLRGPRRRGEAQPADPRPQRRRDPRGAGRDSCRCCQTSQGALRETSGRRPHHRHRAVRRRPLRQRPPGRPRRRGHQDRGPAVGRRRRPLRPAVRRGRGLALLRDVQPQQAQPVPRPVDARRPPGLRGPGEGVRRRVLQPARRRPEEDRDHLRRPEAPEPGDRVLLPDRVRHDGPAQQGARLRLRAAGPRRLDGPDRRAGRPSHQVGPVACGLLRRVRRRDLPAGRAARRAPRRRRHGLRREPVRHGDRPADLPGGVASERGVHPGAHAPLGAPVAGAVPGVPGERRLVHRRLREGEVLDAAGLRHRPPRMGRAGVRLRRRSPTGAATRTS